jgi:hypothetical protein
MVGKLRQIGTHTKVSNLFAGLPSKSLPEVKFVCTEVLKPSPRNARTHSKKQVEQIVGSIRRFGWTYPILIDELGNILCGVGRFGFHRFSDFNEIALRAFMPFPSRRAAPIVRATSYAARQAWTLGSAAKVLIAN